jgi:hypothetical protein
MLTKEDLQKEAIETFAHINNMQRLRRYMAELLVDHLQTSSIDHSELKRLKAELKRYNVNKRKWRK